MNANARALVTGEAWSELERLLGKTLPDFPSHLSQPVILIFPSVLRTEGFL